jgi:hypothetical protein
MLERHSNAYCLGILHRDTESPHTFSRKYSRMLPAGHIYIRFGFSLPDPSASQVQTLKPGMFATLGPDDLVTWLSALRHPRIFLTTSEGSCNLTSEIVNSGHIHPEHLWAFQWGTTANAAIDEIQASAGMIEWLWHVQMVPSYAAFWLVRRQDVEFLFVYPVAWDNQDALESIGDHIRFRAQPTISSAALLGVLDVVVREGF